MHVGSPQIERFDASLRIFKRIRPHEPLRSTMPDPFPQSTPSPPARCAAAAPVLLVTFAILGVCVSARPGIAQPLNRVLFEEMAVDCLGTLPETEGDLILHASEEMPYVRAVLVAAWQADGRTIFLPDSTKAGLRIAYAIEEADVHYEKRRRKQLAREVRLVLRYDIADQDGRVLADERCALVRSDIIARAQRTAVETEAWPETQGAPPRRSRARRMLEPVVLTAAMTITAWLFFSLRSPGEDSS